jgi:hypothetical protein
MTTAVLRKELINIINVIPDRDLPALKPLLVHLAEDYWKPVIEPASKKEIAMVNKRMNDYEKNPSSFVPLRKKKTAG